VNDSAALNTAQPVAPSAAAPIVELTVVSPAFNERGNVERLVAKLTAALADVRWELIVVDDDSPDGTADLVKQIAQRDGRVRCLRRVGRRGLAGAVIEGVMASAAPYVAVIDADLQHDETILPDMLALLRAGDCDVVIGSRYLDAAGLAEGLSPIRKFGSQVATAFGRRALGVEVTDPVSGFFMIRREAVDAVAEKLEPAGFKILFDILASQPRPLRVKELPYAFQPRQAGESKLDGRVVLEYFGLVASKLTGGWLSPNFLFFSLAGASGLVVHMAVLLATQGLVFTWAQTLAAVTAMTSNYLVGNAMAYRDRRRRGWRLATGYLRYASICAVGLAGNVAVASLLARHGTPRLLAGLVGAGCGAVWNYVSTFVW
jgi:dolichol-phosphate mannosyltransferase